MVLERTTTRDYPARDYPAGEYRSSYFADNGIGAGRAFGGVLGIFVSLGVGLAILAFAAAYGIGGTVDTGSAQDVGSGVMALLVGVLPLFAALPLAVGAGGWSGYSTRSGGQGFAAGFLGSIVGVVLMFVIIALGFALGGAAAGITPTDITAETGGLDPNFANLAGYFLSIAGLLYLLVVGICGGLAGAFIGGMVPKTAGVEERDVVRRPVV